MVPPSNSRSQRFLNAYNRLDQFMRTLLEADHDYPHTKAIGQASKLNERIQVESRKLRSFARLRNAIVHNPDCRAEPIAEPHVRIVDAYEQLVEELIRPVPAHDHWVPADQIYAGDDTFSVFEVMNQMVTRRYSHLPILRDGVVVGVFSEWTPMDMAQEAQELVITPTQQLCELAQWTHLARPSIREAVRFAPADTSLDDLRAMFRSSFQERFRIGVVFFTQNGHPEEPLLGLMTPWDLVHLG